MELSIQATKIGHMGPLNCFEDGQAIFSVARDGFLPYISSTLSNNKASRCRTSLVLKLKIWNKIRLFLEKGCMQMIPCSEVTNVTDFFSVEKGEDDIRMVFNGTKSGYMALP